MTEQVRWALVGFGAGGRIFHAPLLASVPEIDFAAVVVRSAETAAQVRRLYPQVHLVDKLESLSELGVTAVTISTPSATHARLGVDAAAAGFHTVVDKPFGINATQARTLAQAGERAQRLMVPFHNRRFDADFLTLKWLLAQGKLTDVHSFYSRFDRLRPVKPSWHSHDRDGGGLLLDLGPHLIDQALDLFGPVREVTAQLRTLRADASLPDAFDIQLRHHGQVCSYLTASLAAPAPGWRLQVQGLRAGFRIATDDVQEIALKAGYSPADLGAAWGQVPPQQYGQLWQADGMSTVTCQPGAWPEFYRQLARAINGEGQPPATAAQAIAVMEVLDAVTAATTDAAR